MVEWQGRGSGSPGERRKQTHSKDTAHMRGALGRGNQGSQVLPRGTQLWWVFWGEGHLLPKNDSLASHGMFAITLQAQKVFLEPKIAQERVSRGEGLQKVPDMNGVSEAGGQKRAASDHCQRCPICVASALTPTPPS